MISKDAKIVVVGAGAIGGITAALIKKAGWKLTKTSDRCPSTIWMNWPVKAGG